MLAENLINENSIMENKNHTQQLNGVSIQESRTSQVVSLAGFDATLSSLSVTHQNPLTSRIPEYDKDTKNALLRSSAGLDIRQNSFISQNRNDPRRRSRSRSRDRNVLLNDQSAHHCTCRRSPSPPDVKRGIIDRMPQSDNDRVQLTESQMNALSHAPIFNPHQMSLEGIMDTKPQAKGPANNERKPNVTGTRRRSRRVVPTEAIIPLPAWAKIALAEKGSGRTAGRLHGIVRAWSEVLHLHRGVTTVAEAIDRIADVSKASRVQAFKYYRCLKWQNFPFDSSEARSIPMSKLRQGSVQLNSQTFSLAPDMLKAMDSALGREESVQIARDNLQSSEWRISDQVWSGPASYTMI